MSEILQFVPGAPGWAVHSVWLDKSTETLRTAAVPVIGFAMVRQHVDPKIKDSGETVIRLVIRDDESDEDFVVLDSSLDGHNFTYFSVAPGDVFEICKDQAGERLRRQMAMRAAARERIRNERPAVTASAANKEAM